MVAMVIYMFKQKKGNVHEQLNIQYIQITYEEE